MGLQVVPVPLIIFVLVVFFYGIEGRIVSSSSSVKTLLTAHGDTYDCVDFYKQPAFDHPLLKNHTFDYKMTRPTPLPYAITNECDNGTQLVSTEIEGEGCPIGTVPIRRVAKVDFPRKIVTNGRSYNAIARKTGRNTHIGAGAFISLHNPKVTGQQYSVARIKIQNGDESIEAGWRVDPTLYGDDKTRFFIRTDVGKSHCFNTLCPGFVLISSHDLLDKPFSKVTQPSDAKVMEIGVFLSRGEKNDWTLGVGHPLRTVGYWPTEIFTSLKDVALDIQWGGEVYDPNPNPTAQMGAGRPFKNDKYDAFMRRISEYNPNDKLVDASDVEAYSDSTLYSSKQEINDDPNVGCVVFYGGPN